MSLIVKIAWRNIMRHRGKSFVIGAILFVGALLMTAGNGVISGMDRGLEKNIVNGFSGHIVLVSNKQQSDDVFIDMTGKSIEPIHNFLQIDSVLKSVEMVDRHLPVGKNLAMVLNEEGGAPGFSYILGVDFEEYRKMFPDNIRPIEGRLLNPGETGVLVPTGARKEMFDYTNIWFICENCSPDTANMPPAVLEAYDNLEFKDDVVYMGMSTDNTSTDIRVAVKGIIKYNALNRILGSFSITDIESYRRCLGYFTEGEKVELSKEEKELLTFEEDDLNDLFSDGGLFEDTEPVSLEENELLSQAADGKVPVATAARAGTYNLVLVLLKDPSNLEEQVVAMNRVLDEHDLGVRAMSWKKAMGMIGGMATIIKTALFVFVMLLFLVAIIIIVNTLSMAAIERTPEIGMMRAIGAEKKFIGAMFFGETALLSFFFGGLGVVTGLVLLYVLRLFEFTTSNDMVQLLFGGDTFQPYLSVADLILVLVQLVGVTLLAVIYPLFVARGITPLDAVSRE